MQWKISQRFGDALAREIATDGAILQGGIKSIGKQSDLGENKIQFQEELFPIDTISNYTQLLERMK